MKKKSIEDQLRDLVARATKSSDTYEKQIEVLRKKLKNCTHKYTTEHEWEHDNGYGRQTRQTSPMCNSCGQIKYWNLSDNWTDPND